MNAPVPLANGLYPIVRRVRRPLILVDDGTGAPAPPPPQRANGETAGKVSYAEPMGLKRKGTDESVARKED